ncbi:hypothetical protein BDV29DRAFT_196143 [Aspergillus leporis]|uniref:GPI anchored protein n=1 Tax=Aspergillus leporis TaxID=41062 RepID=A0A5N5WLB6_9EURO|nr:hypothetical protein BDV29DRAFT_196143 [Aspergillus leporis]
MNLLSILFLTGHTLAIWHKSLPVHESHNFNNLIQRESGNCTINTTCSECYGSGNILCDNAGCFNPDAGEQCCKGGYSCAAWDNSCCESLGTGTPGTDGVVPLASATASSTGGQLTTITCTIDQTNDECCSQNGHYSLRWCAGVYPNQECYNPKRQTCCSDGTVCMGERCCDIVVCFNDLLTLPITPNPAEATALPSSRHSSSKSTATTGSKAEATETATNTPGNAATPSPSGNGATKVIINNRTSLGVAVVMVGLIL